MRTQEENIKERKLKNWKKPVLNILKNENTQGGDNPNYTEDFAFDPGPS
jgi:hypothetical protein